MRASSLFGWRSWEAPIHEWGKGKKRTNRGKTCNRFCYEPLGLTFLGNFWEGVPNISQLLEPRGKGAGVLVPSVMGRRLHLGMEHELSHPACPEGQEGSNSGVSAGSCHVCVPGNQQFQASVGGTGELQRPFDTPSISWVCGWEEGSKDKGRQSCQRWWQKRERIPPLGDILPGDGTREQLAGGLPGARGAGSPTP